MSARRTATQRRFFAAGPRVSALRALGFVLGSSMLATMGCGFDAATPAAAPQNTCTLVDDCLAGTCVEGLCVEPAPEALRVFIEVEPLNDALRTQPQRWSFTPEVVVGPGTQDLVLPPGVEVVGRVRFGDLAVPADIAFTRLQDVPVGMQEALRTRTYAEPTLVDVNGASFAADFASVLAGGATYEVTITPTTAPFGSVDEFVPATTANRVVPPLVLRNVTLPSDVTRWELQVDIADFQTPCTANTRVACRLSGDVVRISELGDAELENGLQVRAIERSTGRVVSSLGITEEGHFEVAVAPDTGPYALRVSAGADRPLFPEVTTDITYDDVGELLIEMPNFVPVVYSGTVENAAGEPLADAQVQFSANRLLSADTGLEASLQRTVVTGSGDAAGQFELSLLPGVYDVIVTPASVPTQDPRDEPGILAQQVTLGDGVRDVRGQLLVVPRRTSFGAQVWTPSGETLPLEVEATPLRREGAQGLVARYNRSATTTAGPSGWFDLRLDLGLYDIQARPPADGGFPWVIFPGVSVAIPGSTSTRMIDIGMPVPRSGVVRANDGTPLAGARVTAYVIVDDPEGERAVRVATTVSGADGSYRLLLPSRLEPAR